jgi:hypothetical protein
LVIGHWLFVIGYFFLVPLYIPVVFHHNHPPFYFTFIA